MHAAPDWYCAAVLAEAEAICRGSLAVDASQPDKLHVLGLLASRKGHHDFAVACLTRALQRERGCGLHEHGLGAVSTCWADLGDALSRGTRQADALGAYLRALTFAPHDPSLYHRIGRALHERGRLVEASAILELGLQLTSMTSTTPTSFAAAICRDLGDVRLAQGRAHDALVCYERALTFEPSEAGFRAAIYDRIGEVRLGLQEWHVAAAAFRQGLRVDPDSADLHAGLGRAFCRIGAFESAADACQEALSLDPSHVDAARVLVLALEALGRAGAAVSAWEALAQALTVHRRSAEAAAAWTRVLSQKPTSRRAQLALGHLHAVRGENEHAMQRFDAALALGPDDANSHIEVGWASHLMGEADRGWEELRWYFHPQSRKSRPCVEPLWDGTPLDGRSILLWAEPQLGDTIQSLRYAALVRAHGGRVIVECDRRLVPLVSRMSSVDRAVARGAPLPPFDVHAPLLLVPSILRTGSRLRTGRLESGTTLRSGTASPDLPYLSVDRDLVQAWREHLGSNGDLTVGLSWAGKPTSVTARTRFTSLAALSPLAGVPGVRFISLQVGPWTAELLVPPAGLHVECLQDESCSLADTAALICNLDLMISVDTMVAHLAGALGRPVWTLLPFRPDWRWPRRGEATSWYPTMRLFRQERAGDWSGLFERVREALSVHARSSLPDVVYGAPE